MLACGHDSGYAPFLGQFAGDEHVAKRITLVEGTPFPSEINRLGLRKTQFSSVFGMVSLLTVKDTAWTLPGAPVSRNSGIRRPLIGERALSPHIYRNPKAQSNRLGPLTKDQGGRRVDKKLDVDEAVKERMKKSDLCFHLFLRGECSLQRRCARNHEHRPLTDEEFDAVWALARQGRCYADRDPGRDCADVMCIYGHGNTGV